MSKTINSSRGSHIYDLLLYHFNDEKSCSLRMTNCESKLLILFQMFAQSVILERNELQASSSYFTGSAWQIQMWPETKAHHANIGRGHSKNIRRIMEYKQFKHTLALYYNCIYWLTCWIPTHWQYLTFIHIINIYSHVQWRRKNTNW